MRIYTNMARVLLHIGKAIIKSTSVLKCCFCAYVALVSVSGNTYYILSFVKSISKYLFFFYGHIGSS